MEDTSFESALAHWCEGLEARYVPIPPLAWALRQNLTVGGAEADDASITIFFQRFDPLLSNRDVEAAFRRARTDGQALRFELLAAMPDSLLVTLRAAEGPSWVSAIELDEAAQLSFQYEPSFQVFEEVRSESEWRRHTSSPNAEKAEMLEGILLHVAPVPGG